MRWWLQPQSLRWRRRASTEPPLQFGGENLGGETCFVFFLRSVYRLASEPVAGRPAGWLAGQADLQEGGLPTALRTAGALMNCNLFSYTAVSLSVQRRAPINSDLLQDAEKALEACEKPPTTGDDDRHHHRHGKAERSDRGQGGRGAKSQPT